ncbi:hypothetical protein FGB62_138g028 [Gracilaria domingensis]|nr:hypothetical protein FGB62_138g028 [Gracilaria domingensis]
MSPETTKLRSKSPCIKGRGVRDRIGKKIRSPTCQPLKTQSCRNEEASSTTYSIVVEEGRSEISKPEIILQGTIPSMLEWTRKKMDEHSPNTNSTKHKEQHHSSKQLRGNAIARRLHAEYEIGVMTGRIISKADIRLLQNVCSLAARLPSGGAADVVLEAMKRYPSSALVYWGLKNVFGKQMMIGNEKIQRITLSKNAVAVFSSSIKSCKALKEWFEDDTHAKMQETVFHMLAISEYILRCAFISKQRDDRAAFPSLIEERIQLERDGNGREVLSFQPWNILAELSDKDASICLEQALCIAHKAVLEGAAVAQKRYGRNKSPGKARKKINLLMLQQPLKEIMDRVIKGLESSAEEVVSITFETDFFHFQASRALRKMVTVYEDIYGLSQEKCLYRASSRDSYENRRLNTKSKPYTYKDPDDDRGSK